MFVFGVIGVFTIQEMKQISSSSNKAKQLPHRQRNHPVLSCLIGRPPLRPPRATVDKEMRLIIQSRE